MNRARMGWVLTSVVLMSACARAEAPMAAHGTPAVAPAQAPSPAGTGSPIPELGRVDRRIVRHADLDIAVVNADEAERHAGAIAEEAGGYVASSERSRRVDADDQSETAVSLVLRVPSERFAATLGRLRNLGLRTMSERVGSEDVTEEFIDLKARIGAQKALEAQYLEILKQARSVKDALDVNAQLADVRTTVEKLEGRRQFLESETALSTIKLGIVRDAPLVSASRFGFVDTAKRAGSDVVNESAAIVHGAIRLLGLALPIVALVLLPLALIGRALLRRARRQSLRV